MWHCHRPVSAAFGRASRGRAHHSRQRCAASVSLADPPCALLAGSAHFSERPCAPPEDPKAASASGVPEPECGQNGRSPSGAAARSVTSYLQRKRFYCWPCLVHDRARRKRCSSAAQRCGSPLCSCLTAAAPTR